MTTFTPEEEILASGIHDWVDFSEAHDLTKRWAEGQALDVETELARVIRALLQSGWVMAGDVTEGQGPAVVVVPGSVSGGRPQKVESPGSRPNAGRCQLVQEHVRGQPQGGGSCE
jgi:hypothetical protein